jgi:hypothetical protein
MTKPLFSSADIQFEKVAFATKLEEDSSNWPSEILKHAYKQLPYLHKYEADVDIDRMDESRGYAVGKLLVYPARMQKRAASKTAQLVSFPVIVRDHELAPLDVYNHKDSMHPEDEESVHELLFRPEMFERSAPTGSFGGTDISSQTTPPGSSGRYQGAMQKVSSVSMWDATLPTFTEQDVTAFKEDLREDVPVRNAFIENEALRGYLEDIVKHAAADTTWSAPPTVVQIYKEGIGYKVKVANHKAYRPSESSISRFQAQDMLSEKSMETLLSEGHVTLTVDPTTPYDQAEKTAQEVNRAGEYRTYAGGRLVEGFVVPKMVDFSGRNIDMQLFLGGDTHAMQEKVAGVFTEDKTLEGSDPYGSGVFVYQEGSMAVATEPIKILNRSSIANGQEKIASYHAKSLSTGVPVKITVLPGLRKMASIGEYEVAIPDSFKFVSLRGKQVSVSSTPSDVDIFKTQKVAGASSVELISDGSAYSLRGANASLFQNEIMGRLDAEFALSSLGLTGSQIRSSVKTASEKGSILIPHTRRVVDAEAFASKVAGLLPDVENLRVNLVKEASVIVDKETTDAILSLRFVTPENVGVYVDYIPELEKISSKLAELLVASRLGMDDVKEAAAKNAMSQVSSVVRGLEKLRAKTQ